jgi:uncharacterized protein
MTPPESTETVAHGRCVIVVAKEPVPGAAKTRLCPPLSPDDAAALAEAFLMDTAARVSQCVSRTAVGYSPEDSRPWFAERFPDFLLFPQGDGDLGRRMARLLTTAYGQGYSAVTLVGTDAPQMTPQRLDEAFSAVENGADIAIGPAADGGYYLICMRQPHEALFERIPWGESGVLAKTLKRAESIGLTVELLPEERDIDVANDLAWLFEQADLARTSPAAAAVMNRLRHTYGLVSSSV